jgi:hypothetical protein
MTVFYDRQAVTITERTFAVDADRYAVDAIEAVVVDPRRMGRVVRFGLVLLPLPMAAIVLASAYGPGPAVMFTMLAGVLALSVVVAVVTSQGRPRPHELWIHYEGRPHKVFETREEWRVKQLARALRRAMASNAVAA